MARSATKRLGVLGILREVLAIPVRNPGLVASVLFVLLLPRSLLLTFPKLSPRLTVNIAPVLKGLSRPQEPSRGVSPDVSEPRGVLPGVAEPGGALAEVPNSENIISFDVVAPVDLAIAYVQTVAMVYLSAVVCKGKHSTLDALLSKVRRSWKKVAISALYFKLLHFVLALLHIMFRALMLLFNKLPSWAFSLLVLAFIYFSCSGFLFCLYLDIASRLSLLVSAVEEDKGGIAALAKAVGLTRRRKLQGIVLTALFIALKQLAGENYAKARSMKKDEVTSLMVALSWRFAHVLVGLSASLLGWLLWAVYYYECDKNHGLMMVKDEREGEGQSLIPVSGGVDGDLMI